MALGATPSGVVAMVVSQASRPVVAGIAGGLIGAFLLTRALETMLFGVTTADAMTFVGAVRVECGGHGGVLRPRLAASRIDPMVALRNE